MFYGLEEGNPTGLGQASSLQVLGQVALQRVVTGHFVELAALLVEADPEPPLLMEDIADVQAAGGGDTCKREHHDADQGAVAQPHNGFRFNGAQQVAGLLGRQHGLALAELLARGFTESAGLCSSTPPVTRWSKSMRMAAMCCLRVAVERPLA